MKVIMQMEFELTNPVEKLVYDLLNSLPKGQRREYLMSALLYYSRSPSFLAEQKMEGYMKKMEELAFVFSDPNYQDVLRQLQKLTDVKDQLAESVADRVASLIGSLEFAPSRSKKAKKVQAEELPESTMDSLLDSFSTE